MRIIVLASLIGLFTEYSYAQELTGANANPRNRAAQDLQDSIELVVQATHTEAVTWIESSPDKKIFASASKGGTVKLWDIESGRLIRNLINGPRWVNCVAFSPDGRTLAAGSGDHVVRLWDIRTGQKIRELHGHTATVTALKFSFDGKVLVSGSKGIGTRIPSDDLIIIWDLVSGVPKKQISGKGTIKQLAFLPDGRSLLATTINGKTVSIWNSETGQLLRELEGPTGDVRRIIVSPNGKYLAAKGRDVTISSRSSSYTSVLYIWHLQSERSGTRIIIEPYTTRVAIAFTPDNESIMSITQNEMKFWDVTTGKLKNTLPVSFESWFANIDNSSPSGPSMLYGTADGLNMAYGTAKGWVGVVELKSGKLVYDIRTEPLTVWDIAFSSDGTQIAVATEKHAALWDIQQGHILIRIGEASKPVLSITYGLNDTSLITAGYDGEFSLWDGRSGKLTKSVNDPLVRDSDPFKYRLNAKREEYKDGDKPPPKAPTWKSSKTRDLKVVSFFPDKQILAHGGNPGYVSILNIDQNQQYDVFEKDQGSLSIPNALTFSPDGKTLAIGFNQRDILLWNLQKKTIVKTLDARGIRAMVYSSDGLQLFTANYSNEIQVWNTLLWELEYTIKGQRHSISTMDVSPAGDKLAVGSLDNKINILSLPSGELLETLHGHISAVNTVAYSPIGNVFASGSEDGTFKIWNSTTYDLLATGVTLPENNWFVFDSNGFFDGSRDAWQLMPFRFSSQPFLLYEPEQFFNQFFQPEMLAEVFRTGKHIRESLRESNDPRANLDIEKYRASKLPVLQIKLQSTNDPISDRTIQVLVEVKDTGSGIRDLRVFRNQSLVHFEHGDLTTNPQTGNYELLVSIKLVAGDNEITAYAFNHDNIKSKNERINLTGAKNLERRGTAYILAVGINNYANSDFKLNYAVDDARSIGDSLKKHLNMQKGHYETVKRVELINKDATKANILAALDLLSGKKIVLPDDAPEQLRKLKKAEPEDDIIVFFAGHGMAEEDRYYIIPHDLGYSGKVGAMTKAEHNILLAHSISDREFEAGFEKVDASNIMFIIDACQSGQALEANEKRRGPMNSRGLAQLAYEKGMYILAAAQSYQAALEFERLGHGLLTYVLVEDGLNNLAADLDEDQRITAREWLDYPVQNLNYETRIAHKRAISRSNRGAIPLDEGVTGQAPKVYYRREIEGEPWVIAIE